MVRFGARAPGLFLPDFLDFRVLKPADVPFLTDRDDLVPIVVGQRGREVLVLTRKILVNEKNLQCCFPRISERIV
jgi:hypothetical protein